MEYRTTYLDEYLIRNKGQPFPFRRPGSDEFEIARSLTSNFPGELGHSPQTNNLPSFIAINHMFNAGQDDHTGAKTALLHDVFRTNPSQAYKIGKQFGLGQSEVDIIEQDFSSLERLIEQPTVTIKNVVESLSEKVYPMKGFITKELSDIAGGIKKPDPLRLNKLAYVVELYFARANDSFEGNWSLNGELSAMIGCMKDVAFWTQYPESFALMSNIIRSVSDVPPEDRYSYTHLTNAFTLALTNNVSSSNWTDGMVHKLLGQELVSEQDIRDNNVRVIGNIKPVSRAVAVDLEDQRFISAIIKAAGEVGTLSMLPITKNNAISLLETTLQKSTEKDVKSIGALLQEVRDLRWMGYDQRRCRIQVADPKIFDNIVNKLHGRIKMQRWGAITAKILYLDPHRSMYNMKDYLRISKYDGENKPTRIPVKKIPKKTSDVITKHIHHLEENELGYAAYHHHGTLVLGNRPCNVEIQVTLGTAGMEQMNKMTALAYATEGNFETAGLTSEYVQIVHEKALKEIQSFNNPYVTN